MPLTRNKFDKQNKQVGNSSASAKASGSSAAAGSLDLRSVSLSSTTTARSRADANELPENAAINAYVWKYTDRAGDFYADLQSEASLYCVQVQHEASPSICGKVLDALQVFLQEFGTRAADAPGTIKELQQSGVYVSITRTKTKEGAWLPNPDGAPLRPYALTFWIVGDEGALRDFFEFFVHFVEFRALHAMPEADKRPWPALSSLSLIVHGQQDFGLQSLAEDFATQLTCEIEEPQQELALSVFSVEPPRGRGYLICELDVVSSTEMIAGWTGHRTYSYRSLFDLAQVPRPAQDPGNWRILPVHRRDFSTASNRQFLKDIFGRLVLHNVVCCVRVKHSEDAGESTSPVSEMLAELRAMPNLFFDAF